MKKFLPYITLIVPLIAVLLGYFLNRRQVELYYTLSSKIPSKFVSTSDIENLQVAEIFNNGNEPANHIQIKVSTEVLDYDILKNSFQDSITIFKNSSCFELSYQSLSPYGSIKIVFKTKNEGIHNKNFKIVYNNGLAIDASQKSNNIFINILLIILILIIFTNFLLEMRRFSIDKINTNTILYNHEKILFQSKPFYMETKKWDDLRKKAISILFNYQIFSSNDLSSTKPYKYLDSDKSIYLTEEEWSSIIKNAKDKFKEHFIYIVNEATLFSNKIEHIFELVKPKHLSELEWADYINKSTDIYLFHKKKLTLHIYLQSEYSKLFQEQKPTYLPQSCWEEYQKYLFESYEVFITSKLLFEKSPYNYLKDNCTFLLEKHHFKNVIDLACDLEKVRIGNLSQKENAKSFLEKNNYEWLSKRDYNNFVEQSKKTIEYDNYIKKIDFLKQSYSKILLGIHMVDEKPSCLTDKEWEELCDQSHRIKLYIDKYAELNKNNGELIKIKEKIEKQLFIIDKCLNEPNYINKIEDYDNTFSKGNFENIRKLATIMSCTS